jgi:hypothetical protein
MEKRECDCFIAVLNANATLVGSLVAGASQPRWRDRACWRWLAVGIVGAVASGCGGARKASEPPLDSARPRAAAAAAPAATAVSLPSTARPPRSRATLDPAAVTPDQPENVREVAP